MFFIKNFTEKLLENEYKPIANFYSSKNIDENTEYIAFVKQVGQISYCVVVINADKKYDYKGFYKDVLSYLNQLNKAVVTGVFVTSKLNDEIIDFTNIDIDDYQNKLIDVRWIADTENNKLIVNGEQPNKILNIDDMIKASFHNGAYAVGQDLGTLIEKNEYKKWKYIKSSNIAVTLTLIIINGLVELINFWLNVQFGNSSIITKGGISREMVLTGQWYRLLTYMFIHGSLIHYAGNALSLYIFGSRVERYFGKTNMFVIYLIGGLGGGLVSMCLNGGLAVGASGAIFALIGAVLSYTKIKERSIGGFDTYLIVIFIIIGLLSGFMMADVDNWGHIGGFIFGLVVSYILLKGDNNEDI